MNYLCIPTKTRQLLQTLKQTRFTELPEQSIDFIYDVTQFVISVCGRQLQLHDEPVHLVDADGDGHALLNRVFDEPFGVQHHLSRDGQTSSKEVGNVRKYTGEQAEGNSLLLLRR